MSLPLGTFRIVAYSVVSIMTVFVLSKTLHILMPTAHLLSTVVTAESQSGISGPDGLYRMPPETAINDLNEALEAKDIYGFIFNSSQTPWHTSYSTYNWCDMPNVRKEEYVVPPADYRLAYVEVIHRHHKRTPYIDNTFPVETQHWSCANAALYQYGQPSNPIGNISTPVYQSFYYDPSTNPFSPAGFPPHDCAFPQITRQGLDDSLQHGEDIFGVYNGLLNVLPAEPDPDRVSFRVTNNPITAQVAGLVLSGMFGSTDPMPLHIQPPDIDSLEPTYSCPAADTLESSFGPGSKNPTWQRHLDASSDHISALDEISGVDPKDPVWHESYDHYFDNLSARLCHQHPLPCNDTFDPPRCVTQDQANEVFRLGEWEYAWQYRGAGPETLQASRASFGVWVAELANNLRAAANGGGKIVYRHDVAHDGSISRLLSILQLSVMVWPGMGSEVVFELWKKAGDAYVRILWSGLPLESSSPTFRADEHGMIALNTVLEYFDELVGRDASKVKSLCGL